MLVLTRKIDEAIMLGDNVKVTVLGIDGDHVRLGIEAPKSLRIFRMELLEQTKDVNFEAIQAPIRQMSFTKKEG